MRLASVSVDLDEIPNYFEIHGLGEPTGPAASLVYDVALARLRSLADAGGFPLTLFTIGRDVAREAAGAGLRDAAAHGHEIANHSLDHRYDLVRLGRAEIERQIDEGANMIERATGQRPVGFRAPGYTITDEVFEILTDLGIAYDASVFPCPAYFAAKAAAIGAIAARGRTSRSIIDTPKVLLAPTRPYRIGKPYWQRGEGLLEIPVQVTRGLRLPFFGTSVTLAGPSKARLLTKMCLGEPLVNLELHGIDVLDKTDVPEALARAQPGLALPAAEKLKKLRAALVSLRQRAEAMTLERAALAVLP